MARVLVAPGNAGDPRVNLGSRTCRQGRRTSRGCLRWHTSARSGSPWSGRKRRWWRASPIDSRRQGFASSARAPPPRGWKAPRAFAKAFLSRHRIPTARYAECTSMDEAASHIRGHGAPIVVKADGLAAGKGVVVARSEAEALAAAGEMLSGRAFGDAGAPDRDRGASRRRGSELHLRRGRRRGRRTRIVTGPQGRRERETRGRTRAGWAHARRRRWSTRRRTGRIMREIVRPTVEGLAAAGTPYTGFLYAGLMIDTGGAPRVIEFNCRLGDRRRSRSCSGCAPTSSTSSRRPSAATSRTCGPSGTNAPPSGVVMAAAGYPGSCDRGHPIAGLDDDAPDTKSSMPARRPTGTGSSPRGGRVLCVCGLGEDVTEAQRRAFERVETVGWNGAWHRA